MAAIFFVSSLPNPPLPSALSDKTGHLLAYAGLALLATRAYAGGLPARVTGRVAASAFLLTAGYGAFDELHQWFTLGRMADFADVVADAIGACTGIGASWAWGIIAFRPHA
jgi:VanZ family protein